MKSILFRAINRIGGLLSHRQRRFLLDRLGLGKLIGRVAKGQFEEIALPSGLKVTINPLLHGSVTKDGRIDYEDDVSEALLAHLKPGGVFYDVGANIGVFSFIAASTVGANGAVHAFEPEANNLECFQQTLRNSGLQNVTLHDVAVGSSDGSMTFDRRGGAFSGRLVDGGQDAEGASMDVRVRAIDSLIQDGLAPPDLVKIDVEGGEGGVLEGMHDTLRSHRPVLLCELHFFDADGLQRAVTAVREAGYSCQSLDGQSLSLDGDPSDLPRHVLCFAT